MGRPARTLRVGFWNVERDRDRDAVARQAAAFLADLDLDALGLAETPDYIDQLDALPGSRLISFSAKAGQAETALLVADGREFAGAAVARMTTAGWVTVRGGHTPPKWLPSVAVEGLTVAAGHTAPSVDRKAGEWVGPFRRVRSFLEWEGHAERWLAAQDGPTLLLADFNEPPSSRGHGSPHWVAAQAGAVVVASTEPTHGHEVIDYALAKDCEATVSVEGKGGSDHNLIVFEVTY